MGRDFDASFTNYHELNSRKLAEFASQKSVFTRVHPWLLFFFRPARHQLLGQTQMIQHARHHGVHHFLDGFRI